MTRGRTLLIVFALFIDLIQAAISMSIASIASVPGTVGGAALGCSAGSYFLGQIGCLLGGGALFIFGSALNPILAPFTIPFGIVLGFAINISLSVTLGSGLIALLAFNGMLKPKQLLWGGGEMIPGLNNIPFWTALVVACLFAKKTEENGKGFGFLSALSLTTTKKPQEEQQEFEAAPARARSVSRIEEEPQELELGREPQRRAPALSTRSTMGDIRPAQRPLAANDNIPRAVNDNLRREQYAA